MKATAALFVLLLSLAPLSSPTLAQTPGLITIGAAGAVKGLVQATAPGAAVGRIVQSGKPLYLNDHVTTDAVGRLQVLLLDETVFTVGPRSDMVLDEFVYDPRTNAGKITARLTKGVFRFVTGKVARQNPANMKILLPAGTIGIRGTIAGINVVGLVSDIILLGPGRRNSANEPPGSVYVENVNIKAVLDRPGFGSTVEPGKPPTPPADMSGKAAEISQALKPDPDKRPAPQESQYKKSPPATEEAGQHEARAQEHIYIDQETSMFSTALNKDITHASQDAAKINVFSNGIAQWDQVRLIPTGTGFYTGAGQYLCTGGSCGAGLKGDFSYGINIDFGNRTIGGPGSANAFSDIFIDNPPPPAPQFASSSASSLGTPGLIAKIPFSALQGDAVIVLVAPAISNPSFDGTALILRNHDGIIARDLQINLNFEKSSGEVARGSHLSSR
jgi:hypothetical protein